MSIFISHASNDTALAERIYLALIGEGHEVFFDRKNLPPGEEYDSKIRQGIVQSNLFLFLISASSIEPRRYTLTELQFASDKWPHPKGHVLPVLIEKVPYSSIPEYLKAVSILEPEGNIPADVLRSVAELQKQAFQTKLRSALFMALGCLVISLIGFGIWMKFRSDSPIKPKPVTLYTIHGIIQDSQKKGMPAVSVNAIGGAIQDTLHTTTSETGRYTIQQLLTDSASKLPVTLELKATGYQLLTITKPFDAFDSLTRLAPLASLLKPNDTTIPVSTTKSVGTATLPKKTYTIQITITDAQSQLALATAQVLVNGKKSPAITKIGRGSYELTLRLSEPDAQKPIKLTSVATNYIGQTKTITPDEQAPGDVVIFPLVSKPSNPIDTNQPKFADYKIVVWLGGGTGTDDAGYRALAQKLEEQKFQIQVEEVNISLEKSSVVYYRLEDKEAAQKVSDLANLPPPKLVASGNSALKTIKLSYK